MPISTHKYGKVPLTGKGIRTQKKGGRSNGRGRPFYRFGLSRLRGEGLHALGRHGVAAVDRLGDVAGQLQHGLADRRALSATAASNALRAKSP